MAIDSSQRHNLIITAEDRTSAAFAAVDRSLNRLTGAANAAFGRFLGAAGVIAATTALARFAVAGFNAADAMVDLSDRLGIPTTQMGTLKVLADQTDTSLEFLAKKTVVLGGVIQDALVGKTSDATKTLAALGITLEDLRAVQNDSVAALKLFASRIALVKEGAGRTATVINVLGKGAEELVPTFAGGAEAFARAADEANRLGTNLDDLAADKVRRADEAFKTIKRTFDALSQTLGIALADSLVKAQEGFGRFVDALTSGIHVEGPKATRDLKDMRRELEGVAALAGNFPKLSIVGGTQAKIDPTAALAAIAAQEEAEKVAAAARKKRYEEDIKAWQDAIELSLKLNEDQLFSDDAFRATQLEHERAFAAESNQIAVDAQLEKDRLRFESLQYYTGLSADVIEGLNNFETDLAADKFDTVVGYLQQTTAMIGTQSKKAFEISKKIALASAIINGIRGVVAAFAQTEGNIYVKAAAAAAAAAFAAVQVSRIRATSFNGGGSVGSGSVGVGSTSDGGTVPSAANDDRIGGPRDVVVNLYGRSFDREQVIELMEAINDVQADGGTTIVTVRG